MASPPAISLLIAGSTLVSVLFALSENLHPASVHTSRVDVTVLNTCPRAHFSLLMSVDVSAAFHNLIKGVDCLLTCSAALGQDLKY